MTIEWTPEEVAEAAEDAAEAVQETSDVIQETQIDLLDPNDPDWAAFQADDPEWFLRAAGYAVRKYVGWHIYPNRQEQLHKIRTGSRGIIMLPSRFVTQVDTLSIRTGLEEDGTFNCLDADDYTWYPDGWIQLQGSPLWMDWYTAGYYYGNDPFYLPITQPGIAACTFWHGYTTLPDDVKEIAFELAEQSMTVRDGNVKTLMSPGGYRADVTQPFGMSLNPDQKDRLANYRLGMVG